jgi:hypothetical protein
VGALARVYRSLFARPGRGVRLFLDENGVSGTVDIYADGKSREQKERSYEDHRPRPGEGRHA